MKNRYLKNWLSFQGVYFYLNIPAQLVYRDSATLQFTFTGLSFTGRPLYGNN